MRSVDLRVWPQEFVVILGESGSGKTTLLKMINRLSVPTRGRCWSTAGRRASSSAHVLRRRIGYVFQRVGLFPHLTVAENIAITPRLLGWRAGSGASELLDARQLAAGARGARSRPSCPAANSNASASRARWPPTGDHADGRAVRSARCRDARRARLRISLLHERMRLTTVMVTHDVLEAVLLADRIVVMHEGDRGRAVRRAS